MHRAHDYSFLVERWREVAARSGVRLRRLCRADRHDLYYLRSPALETRGGIYVSAGIHGDEAGGTEALVSWAAENAFRLRSLPLILLPCLNPWGLLNNSRRTEDGTDLNRAFHLDQIEMVKAVKMLAAGRRFAASLMLHEDFDGQGIYLYEIQRRKQPEWGEHLLKAAEHLMPVDPRIRIDGFHAANGVIRRKIDHRRFARIGYPEAVWAHDHHSERTFTVEAASECALQQRTLALKAVIAECVRRATAPEALGIERSKRRQRRLSP